MSKSNKTSQKASNATGESSSNVSEDYADGTESGDESANQATLKSQAQAEKALKDVSVEDVDILVNQLVIYLLLQENKKVPIKRQDISKHVLKENKRGYAVIFDRACKQLETVFGIKVVKLDQNRCILVNNLEDSNSYNDKEWPPLDDAKTGLIVIILSLIFMRGNSIGEGELFEALRKLGINEDEPHEVFGDIRKLIMTEFARQGYLELVRQAGIEPPKMNLLWGPRAQAETTKMNILQFVCKVYGTEDLTEFRSQYRDAMESEGGRHPVGELSIQK